MIRDSLLKVCALCGPDEENETGAPKFLCLIKLTTEDYLLEALQICIKWYCNYLESVHKKQSTKKDADMVRKLAMCLDEIKGDIQIA